MRCRARFYPALPWFGLAGIIAESVVTARVHAVSSGDDGSSSTFVLGSDQ